MTSRFAFFTGQMRLFSHTRQRQNCQSVPTFPQHGARVSRPRMPSGLRQCINALRVNTRDSKRRYASPPAEASTRRSSLKTSSSPGILALIPASLRCKRRPMTRRMAARRLRAVRVLGLVVHDHLVADKVEGIAPGVKRCVDHLLLDVWVQLGKSVNDLEGKRVRRGQKHGRRRIGPLSCSRRERGLA